MNNPRLLKKGHEGLDTVVGRDRLWKAKTSRNWNTCKPQSKETLRVYPVASLLVPREAIEDCKLVKPCWHMDVVNVWKVQMDSEMWSNPNEFRPERFMHDTWTSTCWDTISSSYHLGPAGEHVSAPHWPSSHPGGTRPTHSWILFVHTIRRVCWWEREFKV